MSFLLINRLLWTSSEHSFRSWEVSDNHSWWDELRQTFLILCVSHNEFRTYNGWEHILTGVLVHTRSPHKIAHAFFDLLQWPHGSNLKFHWTSAQLQGAASYQPYTNSLTTQQGRMKNCCFFSLCAFLMKRGVFKKVCFADKYLLRGSCVAGRSYTKAWSKESRDQLDVIPKPSIDFKLTSIIVYQQ